MKNIGTCTETADTYERYFHKDSELKVWIFSSFEESKSTVMQLTSRLIKIIDHRYLVQNVSNESRIWTKSECFSVILSYPKIEKNSHIWANFAGTKTNLNQLVGITNISVLIFMN